MECEVSWDPHYFMESNLESKEKRTGQRKKFAVSETAASSFLDGLGLSSPHQTESESAASSDQYRETLPNHDELTSLKNQVDLHAETAWLQEDEHSARHLFENSVSFLSSLIFHLILLILAVLWTFVLPPGPGIGPKISMEFTTSPEEENWDEILLDEMEAAIQTEASEETEKSEMEENPEEMTDVLPEEEMIEPEEEQDSETENELNENPENPANEALNAFDWANVSPVKPEEGKENRSEERQPETLQSGSGKDLNQRIMPARSLPTGGGLGPRTDLEARAKMLAEAGGNAQSEMAVERGLAWIARHQQFDTNKKYFGSWSFDLSRYGISNSGEATSRTAATALALLALMGHGNTREQGEYQKAVQDGVYFLSTQAKSRKTQPGYDFRDSPDSRGMYGHILATLALCEAYSLETQKDSNLHQLALGGLQWILYAQDPNGGGWRYQPHEAGDVSVTTWVVMLLKSAQMAGFEIPSATIVRLDQFLDSISSDEKSKYAYQPGKPSIPSTTAMGLAARVFTGTPRNAKLLEKGTRHIANWGCHESDLYYDYYAALLLRHYGGPLWTTWNEEMRDYLILTQESSGKEAGSWFFTEQEKTNNQIGGRLYTTSLAVMILEVYYRYLPIYQEKSTTGL